MAKLNDFAHGSESFKRRNPHLYNVAGRVCAAQPEQNIGQSLGCDKAVQDKSPAGHGRFRVGIYVHSKTARVTDRDNLIGGLKFLRDAIARYLSVDDSERFIDWEYIQIKTEAREGVLVKIEHIAAR